ncbi:CoA pyrophosphatase [Clostridium paraputrificum]|uniref:NUDIX hydrolase n=1 Tax=Clostridium paraputrificum TaxID=29363 RepID=UPI00325B1BF4
MKINDIKEKLNSKESYINGWEKMKRASIIIPLMDINEEVYVLFQVRAKKLKSQPGDVCFPGGKIDKCETPKEAALREINEELGLKDVEIIKEMDILIRHDGMIIHPFVAKVNNIEELDINEDEVEEIFYLPLSYLLEYTPMEVKNKLIIERGDNFPYHLIEGGKNYKFKTGEYISTFYQYKDYVIWGITASMLKDFINNIK